MARKADMRFKAAIVASLLAAALGAAALASRSRAVAIEPSGPFPVQRHERLLATTQGPYRVLIWAPANHETARAPAPLVLYAPGWGNRADDSASLLADLASHGYIAAAFDDIARDPPRPHESPQERADRMATMSLESPAAYRQGFTMASRRVRLAAQKGSAVLDAILAAPDLAARIDHARIGALGFSFGGAAAVAQSRGDRRIKAVANLNGWLFGKDASAAPSAPYLLFYIDDDFPPADWATSSDPSRRALAEGAAFDQALHRPLLASPDFFWLHLSGIGHDDLSDRPLQGNWRQRMGLAQSAAAEIRQRKRAQFGVIRAFLDTYLKGIDAAFPPPNRAYPAGMSEVRAELLAV